MAARNFSRAFTSLMAGAALLATGVLIGRTSISAPTRPTAYVMPFPAECEETWKDTKLTIETGTLAKVSVSRVDGSVPQFPNLAGIVRIDGLDKVEDWQPHAYLEAATARCYAGATTSVSLNNPQFARLFQLTIADLRQRTTLPLYLTLDGAQIIVHYNQPLPK